MDRETMIERTASTVVVMKEVLEHMTTVIEMVAMQYDVPFEDVLRITVAAIELIGKDEENGILKKCN